MLLGPAAWSSLKEGVCTIYVLPLIPVLSVEMFSEGCEAATGSRDGVLLVKGCLHSAGPQRVVNVLKCLRGNFVRCFSPYK